MKGLRILSGVAIVTLVGGGILGSAETEAPALPPPVTLRAGTSEGARHPDDLIVVPPVVYDPDSELAFPGGSAGPLSVQSADSPDDHFTPTTVTVPMDSASGSVESPDGGAPPPADQSDSFDSDSLDSLESPDD